jgi:hypothetical protein
MLASDISNNHGWKDNFKRHGDTHIMKCLKQAFGRTPDPNCRTKSCCTYSSHALRVDAIKPLMKGCGAVTAGLMNRIEYSHNQYYAEKQTKIRTLE